MISLRLSVAFQASTSDISSTVPSITECEPLRSRYSQTQTCGPVLRDFWRTYPNWYLLRLFAMEFVGPDRVVFDDLVEVIEEFSVGVHPCAFHICTGTADYVGMEEAWLT